MKQVYPNLHEYAIRLMTTCYGLLFFCAFTIAQVEETKEAGSYDTYGNPYLLKDWSAGVVRFTSGREVKQFKLKFDCVQNRLLLQFQGSTFAAESKVQEFVLYSGKGKKKDSMVFRKGFPAIGKAGDNTFFHVMYEGKVLLLRLVIKNIIEEKHLIASQVRHRLEDVELYYLLKDGVMIALPPNKDELLRALPDQATALSAFISENELKFRSPEDFLLVARKYNELLH